MIYFKYLIILIVTITLAGCAGGQTPTPTDNKQSQIGKTQVHNDTLGRKPAWLNQESLVSYTIHVSPGNIRFDDGDFQVDAFKEHLSKVFDIHVAKKEKVSTLISYDEKTPYEKYKLVQGIVEEEYKAIWDKIAIKVYNTPFNQLTEVRQKNVLSEFPLLISEAEPSGFN